VKDFNVRMFLSFVQADGYNPLTVASTLFKVPADALDGLVASLQVLGGRDDAVKASLSKPIRPGQFFMDMHNWKVSFGIDREEVLQKIISASKQYFAGSVRDDSSQMLLRLSYCTALCIRFYSTIRSKCILG